MMDRPFECCECGSYMHTIPMPIKRRVEYIDFCIADIVAALNAANIITECSCCGHEKSVGNIMLKDGRKLNINKPYNKEKEND